MELPHFNEKTPPRRPFATESEMLSRPRKRPRASALTPAAMTEVQLEVMESRSLLCHIESELRDIKQQLSALEAQQNIPEVPELRCQSCAALRSALDGLMQRVDVIDAHLDNRPSISIRAVSAEREEELYRDCFMRGEHQPQVYAASMFMALAPFDAYQTWAKKVNWGGTNGKAELPRDLKEKVHSYVAQRFPDLSSDKWYKVRNSINERLRSPRKVDPERQRIF